MLVKKKNALLLGAVLLLIVNYAIGAEFAGKVTRFIQPGPATYIRPGVDGFNGRLIWMAPVGSFARGPVYDKNGKVIKKGDILAKCDSRFYDYFVQQAKAEIKAKQGLLVSAKYEFERKKNLAPTHAIARSDFDIARGNYLNALGEFEAAKANLKYQELMIEMCTMRAQLDCFVIQHLNIPGSWCNIDYPVMTILALNPMFVNIKMDRKLVKELWLNDYTVKVFPIGRKEPVIAFQKSSFPTKEGIRIPIPNELIPPPKGVKIPVISNYTYIVKALDNRMGVNKKAIQKDDKGSYVWQLLDISGYKPGTIQSNELKVKKVYIKLLNKVKYLNPGGYIRRISDPNGLKAGDAVLFKEIPKDLKDGDTIYYHRCNPLFWVNDEVRVEIFGLEQEDSKNKTQDIEEDNSGINPHKVDTDKQEQE